MTAVLSADEHQAASAAGRVTMLRRARSSDTLVFLATYNERDSITPMLDALVALPLSSNVLVVEDRSTDGTTEILLQRARSERRLALILRPGKLGVGSAHKLGWSYARRFGYRRIVTLDADFSHDPNDIPRLLATLDDGADVAIGSRFMRGGRLDYAGWRLAVSRSANYLARRALRLPIAEYTTSLRAAWLDRVPDGLVETIDSEGYSFFLICAVRFARAGLKIAEVPIHFHQRTHGASKISQLEILRGALNLALLTIGPKVRGGQALAGGDLPNCPVCAHPFLVATRSGGRRCLACAYQQAAALSRIGSADISD